MPPAPLANRLLAFLVPRGPVASVADAVVRGPRALPVNGRTLVIPHDHDPRAAFAGELDVVVGPANARGPFSRVALHTVGTAAFGSSAYLSWVRTEPYPGRQSLRGEPWKDDDPITVALAALPDAIVRGGLDGFWSLARQTKLAGQVDVGADERRAWGAAAVEDLDARVRPVVIDVDAPNDDGVMASGRWAWWPPSFW